MFFWGVEVGDRPFALPLTMQYPPVTITFSMDLVMVSDGQNPQHKLPRRFKTTLYKKNLNFVLFWCIQKVLIEYKDSLASGEYQRKKKSAKRRALAARTSSFTYTGAASYREAQKEEEVVKEVFQTLTRISQSENVLVWH